ncbi:MULTISPECIES: hypothetical protein [unclassified Streptomyces]|uniref:hypothetical protein n=1 Tax=unclassified Streptomyces TaxID=2593676 RepID=UPI00190506B2|nr:hypothetical protein [Streptomyces sp. HSG2]
MSLGLVLAAVLLTVVPNGERGVGGPDGCVPHTIASWRPHEELTRTFADYGDDPARTDDWTGGDGTHSVRLPDGRVLWLFSDTFLGPVRPPPNPAGEPHAWRDAATPLVRNSAVVMRDGRLERTLPAPLFADPGPDRWRWPVAARVEPRAPGSDEPVLRVLLWQRAAGPDPWIYGVPTATEVATLSLPGLRVEGVSPVLDQRWVSDPSQRVLFGTALVSEAGFTYVFGGDDRQAVSGPVSHAYVARVPDGRLDDHTAWRFWTAAGWAAEGRPEAVLGDGRSTGVGSAFSVVDAGDTLLLFTMAAGAGSLSDVAMYWACAPTGPWHGPSGGFRPPLPEGAGAYNPRAHPVLASADGSLVLSHDVNWPGTGDALARLSGNVSLYRPRFVIVRAAPSR